MQSRAAVNPAAAAQVDVVRRFLPWLAACEIASAALAVWLLVAGIGVLRRRRWSRRAILAWAIARMAEAVPAAVLAYLIAQGQLGAMMDSPQAAAVPGGIAVFIRGAGLLGFGWTLALAWAMPVFVLVWFTRRRVREEVAAWGPPPPP